MNQFTESTTVAAVVKEDGGQLPTLHSARSLTQLDPQRCRPHFHSDQSFRFQKLS